MGYGWRVKRPFPLELVREVRRADRERRLREYRARVGEVQKCRKRLDELTAALEAERSRGQTIARELHAGLASGATGPRDLQRAHEYRIGQVHRVDEIELRLSRAKEELQGSDKAEREAKQRLASATAALEAVERECARRSTRERQVAEARSEEVMDEHRLSMAAQNSGGYRK